MSEDTTTPDQSVRPRVGVEILKENSNYLRGTIKGTLESDAANFSHDEYNLLKFHGIYQQDDRDQRAAARTDGRGKVWIMMVRAKVPGGHLTADQYLSFDDVATRYADGTLRVTTRQCFQLHHIGKGDLKHTMQAINDSLVTTLGACGDVERNLMACPAPDHSGAAAQVQEYARLLSDRTLPRTRAYHEIWLDHEKVVSTAQPDEEPLYGNTYLPRKFKSGLAIEGDNCIDAYSQDIGMVAHLADGRLSGFTVLVGGGMGMTHTDKATHPATAKPLCFVEPDQLVDTFLGIIAIQREHGDRTNRKFARMKYLVENWGVDRFRDELVRRLGRPLAPPRPLTWAPTGDHFGWHEQHDGRWYRGVWIENGRIQDVPRQRTMTAFRELVQQFRPGIRLTPMQNIMFTDLAAEDRHAIDALLHRYGVPLDGEVSQALRHSMACPAIPTCGLALAESERALPPVVRRIESILADLGLADERLSIRMTGCPNGCARPYLGDIGFVGRTPGKYQIYVGGDFVGTHLNELYADLVHVDDLAESLRPLFLLFREQRAAGEGFGDFCHRLGIARLRDQVAALAAPA